VWRQVAALQAAEARAKEVRALNDQLIGALERLEHRFAAEGCAVGAGGSELSLKSRSARVMALVAERDLAQRSKDEREGIVSALRVRLRECEGELKTLKRLQKQEDDERQHECERVRRRMQAERDMEGQRHRAREAELERMRDRASEEVARLDQEHQSLVADMQLLAKEKLALETQVAALRRDAAVGGDELARARRALEEAREGSRQTSRELARRQSSEGGVRLMLVMLQREMAIALAEAQRELEHLKEAHIQAYFCHTQLLEQYTRLEGGHAALQRRLEERSAEAEGLRQRCSEVRAAAAAERERWAGERLEEERAQVQAAASALLLSKERDALQARLTAVETAAEVSLLRASP
jgi:hypothetical protein